MKPIGLEALLFLLVLFSFSTSSSPLQHSTKTHSLTDKTYCCHQACSVLPLRQHLPPQLVSPFPSPHCSLNQIVQLATQLHCRSAAASFLLKEWKKISRNVLNEQTFSSFISFKYSGHASCRPTNRPLQSLDIHEFFLCVHLCCYDIYEISRHIRILNFWITFLDNSFDTFKHFSHIQLFCPEFPLA